MFEVYISMRHTQLSSYYEMWLCKQLPAKISTGFDRVRTGPFPEDLAKKIKKCRNFIALFTPDTFGQEDDNENWMTYEIEIALKSNVNIIPVISKDFVWPENLPDRIKEIKNHPTVIMRGNKMLSSDYHEIISSIDEITKSLLPNDKKDVFISYSSKDYQLTESIKQSLEASNIRCWMAPDSIPAGSDYASEIAKAIKNSEICLVVLSKNSQDSKWVPKEIGEAINNGLTVIPFQIDDAIISDSFEFLLINCQKISASTNKDRAMRELINVISNILNN